jgi:hypothetical protein
MNNSKPKSISISHDEESMLAAMRALLQKKGPAVIDSNGNSPLIWAVYNNNISIIRALVELHGLPLNSQNFEGETALSVAVMNNNYDVAKFLIERGADLNVANCRSETPLHQAVVLGNIEMTRLLVEEGSYIDAEDECGETPLHFAVREDKTDIVDYLLSTGADADHSNHDDETPAELAEMVASSAVKEVFINNRKRYSEGHGWTGIESSLGAKSHLLLQKSQKKLTSSSLLSPLSASLSVPRSDQSSTTVRIVSDDKSWKGNSAPFLKKQSSNAHLLY